MLRRARHLTIFVFSAASGILALLQLRFFFLQLLDPERPVQAAAYRTTESHSFGLRGRIFDARGGLVAATGRGARVRVWTDGLSAERKDDIAQLLHREAGVVAAEVRELLDAEDYPIVVEEVLDADVLERLETASQAWHYRALRFEPRFHRIYPYRQLYAPWVGFVDADGKGVTGFEAALDSALSSRQAGRRRASVDGRGRAMMDGDSEARPALDGEDMHLTLDPLIQQAAEDALEQCIAEYTPRWAQAVAVRPSDGAVLAIAQRPAPRNGRPRSKEEMEQQFLMATQEQYTPGSTIKPFVLALCMREGAVQDLGERIDCENGLHYFGRRRLSDHDGGYGKLTIPELLVHSSNIGMAKLLCRLVDGLPAKGSPEFRPILQYFRDFGFGQPVMGARREQAGRLQDLAQFSKNYSLVSMSFGHEMSVTALQMIQATASLIGPGSLQPLRWVEPSEGAQLPPARRPAVLPPAVVRDLRRMLGTVVEEGATAKLRPAGYSMGGKTGTAQNEKDPSKDTMSFFCFAPVEDPQVLVLTVVEQPSRGRFASEVAAPVASKILAEALKSRKVPPDRPEELSHLEGLAAGGRER